MARSTVTVTIPSASGSRSKMQKKGWKCWAKWLTTVATPANDGFAYQGEFTDCGSTVEAEPGDLLLHVDQSSDATLGVVMLNKAGAGFIKWLHDADSAGRKWCGPLGKPARTLLAMDTAERIQHTARAILAADRDNPLKPDVQAYWEGVAGVAADVSDDSPLDTTALAEALRGCLTMADSLLAMASEDADREATSDCRHYLELAMRSIHDVGDSDSGGPIID